jgi:hypothetical protein
VDDAGRNRLVRAAGLVAAAAYAGLIGWLYVQQPVTVAEVRGGLTSSVGPTNCAWRYSAAASAVALFLVGQCLADLVEREHHRFLETRMRHHSRLQRRVD